jgi:hypothetical protein
MQMPNLIKLVPALVSNARSIGCSGIMMLLIGCGLSVPNMQPFAFTGDDAKVEGLKESSLTGFIKCELHFAVQQMFDLAALDENNTKLDPINYPPHPSIDWLRNWGATVSMKITVDEKSTLAPGLSYNSPMENIISTFSSGKVTTPQSFTFGVGASVSSDATRTENLSFYYPFSDLLAEGRIEKEYCSKAPPGTIDADLKIDDFLRSKYEAATVGGLILHKVGVPADGSVSPFLTFTYEVQFVVTTSGNATPTWKLVHVSANPNGPLLALMRTRTDDVIITMGEVLKDEKGKTIAPTPETLLQLQANLIGQAVASALRNPQP